MALNAQTDIELFLFAVKGKPEHSVKGSYLLRRAATI